MEEISVNILLEKFQLNEKVKERCCTCSDFQYTASVEKSSDPLVGCPLGTSFISWEKAIENLKARVIMESKVHLIISGIKRR